MLRRMVSGLRLTTLLASMLTFAFGIQLAPITFPTIRVGPQNYMALRVGQVFDVNITINDLDVGWCLSTVEFRLEYNSTLLEVLDVVDGPFIRYFAEGYPPEYETYRFIWGTEPGYILVGLGIIHPGIWMRIYPEGSGTLATITFNTTAGPQAQCALQLVDTLLVDEWNSLIPHNTEDGYYRILVGDLNVDGKVDVSDVLLAGQAFGSEPGHPRWNPEADINGDGKIRIDDILTVALNFGRDFEDS